MLLVTSLVLASLAAADGALSCTECSNSLYSNCAGSSVNCPSDNQCSTTYIEISANGAKSTNFFRSCSPKNQCNVTGSSTFPGGFLRIATSCCTINNLCIPVISTPPQNQDTVQNGLSCRQCLSINSDQCTSDNSTLCTGNENMCIRLASTVTGYQASALAFRGCATKSICNLSSHLFTTNGLTASYDYICTSGALGLHHGALMPLTVLALLLKFLL